MSSLFTAGSGSDLLFTRGAHGSYANPHSTIAIRDIPTNIKQVMRLCKFYYMQDSLLGAIVDKMSEYPITSLVIEEKDTMTEKTREKWDYLLNVSLDLRNVMKMINVDKYVFGNSFHYLYFPFTRYCRHSSGKEVPLGSLRNIRVDIKDGGGKFGLKVWGTWKEDGYRHEHMFDVVDRRSTNRVGLNLTRLNPLRMRMEYSPQSGKKIWYWKPEAVIRDGLLEGSRAIIETTEMRVLEAAWRDKWVEMNPDRLWVAQADTMPGIWHGWGVPPIFRVLEDVYYYKILRRANEALAQEHVTPLRIISPSGTGDISPQRTMNLSDWQSKIRREMHRFKRDPNHILISPLPLNIEQMGGQARVMMVAAEMEAAARTIAAGIGCPIEMIWGGLNWSGASVSLRVLENHFINDRENSERLLQFLVPKISQYFRLPRVAVELSEFKMADDVQQQQNAINLMLQGFLSRESVLNQMDYDSAEEFRRLTVEHDKINKITMQDNLAASHMNTVIQTLEAKAQVLLQYELQLEEEAAKARYDRTKLENIARFAAEMHDKGLVTPMEFQHSATLLQRMDPQIQTRVLQSWEQTMPFVSKLLSEQLTAGDPAIGGDPVGAGMGGGMGAGGMGMEEGGPAQQDGAAAGMGIDTAQGPYSPEGQEMESNMDGGDTPLPEQRPPQRDSSPI